MDLKKVQIEDSGEKSFLDFKFSYDKPILDQVHELHNYLVQIRQLDITLDTIHIHAIIHKLPSTVKDYRKSLKHDTKEFPFEILCTIFKSRKNSVFKKKKMNKRI